MPSFLNIVLLSFIGGVLPAIFWLFFWLREDRLHPEPRLRVTLVFILGMISVFFVLPIEKFIFSIALSSITFVTILAWAGTEEIFKYISAFFGAMKSKEMDEPIDAVIYMITAALGFSALENALFLSNLIKLGMLPQSIITGNSRFLGATLLHVASSASIGIMMGLSFYKTRKAKILFTFLGLCIGILLHTIFNLLIIKLESQIFFVFSGVWVVIVILLVLIEKIKTIRKNQSENINLNK